MKDYASTLSIDFSLIYPELLLLAVASLILLVSFSRRLSRFVPQVAFVGLALCLALVTDQWGIQQSGFAGMVLVDRFAVLFKVVFVLAAALALLIAYPYFRQMRIERPEFYAMLLFSTMGMIVLVGSSDLVVMFLGLEIMSLPLYVMAGFNRRSLESNEAGIKYFVMGAFATGFLLLGIAFIFGAAETTNMRRIVADIAYISSNHAAYLYSGAALLLIGFAFKIAAVPFHSWVPDVYQGAPTPVTAFFSVAPKAAGFAALLRIFSYNLSEPHVLAQVFWVLAVLTMSVGNILALRQENIKRMLAYSSISHAGYVLVALAAGGVDAISSAMFYLVGYTFFNLGAFAVVSLLEMRAGSRLDFAELAGLSKSNPYLSLILAIFMFALSGFPPTVGFLGKFYVFSSALRSGLIWLAVIGVMNSFVSVYYYLRVVKVSYFDDAEGVVPVRTSFSVAIVLAIALLGTIGLGLFPQQLFELTRGALVAFL